jgi:CBS domain-containing protein
MGKIAANLNRPAPTRTLGDIVSTRPAAEFFETDYVKVVLPLLQETECGAAGVLDDEGRLTGLLTERSILRHVFARSCDRLLSPLNLRKYIDDMTVGEAMIAAPETLPENMPIEEAAALMLRRGYRYMPVVSRFDSRRLLGIVSERELARHLQLQLEETKKSEKAHKSVLSFMLAEPYGCAWQPAEA